MDLCNRSKNLLTFVVYRGVEKYLRDLLKTISSQTSKDFDIFVVNDGAHYSFDNLYDSINRFEILSVSFQTSSENRKSCIDYAKQNDYENIVFCDADDLLESNYIEEILCGLRSNEFVFCDLHPFKREISEINISFLSKYLSAKKLSLNDVIDRNLIGLGHSGIRVKTLIDIHLPANLIAVDWYIFSNMLLRGSVGKFIDKPLVHYRQTDSNSVGIIKKVSKKSISYGAKVKEIHYKEMYFNCSEKNSSEKEMYFSKLKDITNLISYLENPSYFDQYIKIINNNISILYCGWWSEILTLNEIKKYE